MPYSTSQHIDPDPDAVYRVRGTGVPTCLGGTSGSLYSDTPCTINTTKPHKLAVFGNAAQVDNLIGVDAPSALPPSTAVVEPVSSLPLYQQREQEQTGRYYDHGTLMPAPAGWTRRPAAAAVVDPAQQLVDENVVVRLAPRPPARELPASSGDQMSFQDAGCWGAVDGVDNLFPPVPEPEPRGDGARTRAPSIRRWRKQKPDAGLPTLHEPEADNGVTSEPDDGVALGGEATTLGFPSAPGPAEPVHWDANPSVMAVISGEEMSDSMRQFLDYCHMDYPNSRDANGLARGDARYVWRYNNRGWQPLHSLIDSLRDRDFPQWCHQWFDSQFGTEQQAWLLRLFREAVQHTQRQYGSCTPRTHGTQPPNNTPLMLLAKSGFPRVTKDTYRRMMECVIYCGGDPRLVDNHGNNAFMHACGHGNVWFVEWFYNRVEACRGKGFDFNHKNQDGRNALSMVKQAGSNHAVVKKIEDLAKKNIIERLQHEPDVLRPHRHGGSSGANQRERPRLRNAED